MINYDAVQYMYGSNSSTTKIATTRSCKRGKCKPFATSAKNSNNDLNYFVKYYCIAAADGFLCPTWVLLVADAKMSADAFDYCEVQGLSQSRDQVGFLCFCRTRSGNAAFYKWLNENVLCKFVQSIRAINNIGENDYLIVLCDGEKVQIDPYLDASIQEKFRGLNCMIGKVAASCTALTQPLDAFNAFKASKSLLAHFSPDDYMHQESLRGQVELAIQMDIKMLQKKTNSRYFTCKSDHS